MKISVSNIAWAADHDAEILSYLQTHGFGAIEIAPTRVFLETPYEQPHAKLESLVNTLKETYGLSICSMQSIWFGHAERIAGSPEEYQSLLDYTSSAICFAERIGSRNLVFGCPKNRTVETKQDVDTVERFLYEAATIAANHGVVIALEANPAIYNTNFATHTEQAIQIIRELKNPGLMLNLDFGTMIENEENVRMLEHNVDVIHHVHISEPYLKPIQHRREHYELRTILEENGYQGYVSLEMGRLEDLSLLEQSLDYMREVFA